MKVKLIEQEIEVPENVGLKLCATHGPGTKEIVSHWINTAEGWNYQVKTPVEYVDAEIYPTALGKLKELRDDFNRQGNVEEAAGLSHAIDILEGKE